MARIRLVSGGNGGERPQGYQFTAVFVPVYEAPQVTRKKAKRVRVPNPLKAAGYQVTVPLLPGIVTFGRTMEEAREMARDAIQCHIDGLKMAGEPVPDESTAQTEKVRIPA